MKKILITGGSGTIGSSFIKNYYGDYKFYSYSRNEKMQVSLKRSFNDVEVILGSVEDKLSLMKTVSKIKPDVVIHTAALKHVDTGEIAPIQMVKSNIVGTLNIIECSYEFHVPVTIGISTDKACEPYNNYGYSKLLMEKMFMEANCDSSKFSTCRFGNVTHSHGSVLPFWLRLKEDNKPLLLTDRRMNRLMFSKDDAADLVHTAMLKAHTEEEGFVLSKKMKTVNMLKLAQVMSDDIEEVGLRPGDKLDEVLIGKEEIPFTYVDGDFITLKEHKNKDKNVLTEEYSSLTAEEMSTHEMLAITSTNRDGDRDYYGIH